MSDTLELIELNEELVEKDKEIERLNNIINGIEEKINQDIKKLFQERLTVKKIYTADEILNIIKELKENNNEDKSN